MKKLFTYSLSLALFGFMLFTTSIQAKPDCTKVKGSGNTMEEAHGVFGGTASVNINGQFQIR